MRDQVDVTEAMQRALDGKRDLYLTGAIAWQPCTIVHVVVLVDALLVTVEVECVIVGVTMAMMGPSSIKLATERYTQTHEVGLDLALKAMCLDARSVRASFSVDGKLMDIESADAPIAAMTKKERRHYLRLHNPPPRRGRKR